MLSPEKIFSYFFFCAALLLSAAAEGKLTEAEALKKYREANIAYQKLDYTGSIALYENLLKNNYVSAEVYYNLGNAWFKSGDFARAILNYERAKKLRPEDEDTEFNLKIASLNVVDKIETVPQIFYKRWISGLSATLHADTWTIVLIILCWLMFASAALYVMGRTVRAKKMSFILMVTLLGLTVCTAALAVNSHTLTYTEKQAIIMSQSVYVKSSPDEKGTDVFILH